ncbi:hypothetical protein ViNHUV68_36350 [Vibrio sp. NH-UV-68]
MHNKVIMAASVTLGVLSFNRLQCLCHKDLVFVVALLTTLRVICFITSEMV